MSKGSREQKTRCKEFNRTHAGYIEDGCYEYYKKIPRQEMTLKAYRTEKRQEKMFYKRFNRHFKDNGCQKIEIDQ